MTCIVGIEHAAGVTIGVDSASSDGYTLSIRNDSKLFRLGDTLKSGGFATTKDGAEVGGDFLVAAAGRLYTVFGDYQVGHAAEGYDSVGSGGRVALGSLHTTATADLGPVSRCRLALEAAAHHTPSVAPPFTMDTL